LLLLLEQLLRARGLDALLCDPRLLLLGLHVAGSDGR
jgi:hypothetical protein